jgi:DNA polymerase-3 subunit gamma/tau
MSRLATKYRPRRFAEVSGQRATVSVLNRMAQRRNVPPALLFYGAYGSGKTTSARIFGAALNCAERPGPASSWPCAVCPSCKAVASSTSLDVIEQDAASNGTVDRVREICELVQYGTTGAYRVVIFDEAHSMSRDAFNHLLKTLEEPPPLTSFVLVTTERGKILPTVASRCVPFAFTRLPLPVIAARLREVCSAEGIDAEPALIHHLADRADGAMRDGLMLLDQVAAVGLSSLRGWQALTADEDFAPALLSAAAQGAHDRLYAELDRALLTCSDYAALARQLVTCLRDVLVLSAGGSITAQGEALEARRTLALNIDSRRAVRAMGVLWDLQVKYRTEDRRAGLELAAALLSEKLCPPPKANGNGNGHHAAVTAAGLAAMEDFR